MRDEAPNQEEVVHPPGILARTALRAIDAGLRALQRLRSHIETPEADEETSRGRGKRSHPGDGAPPVIAESPPPRKSLLHRFLIVLMCLLIGGVAGMLISHHGFSKHIDSQAKQIDRMQDEITQSRKDEARNLREKNKLQKEIAGYRNSLNEISQEAGDLNRQIAELNTRLSAAQQAGRPASQSEPSSRPTAQPRIQSRTRPKTGTCVTGGPNSTGALLDCIDKLNRP